MPRIPVIILLLLWLPAKSQKRSYELIDSLRKGIPLIPANEERKKALAIHDLATQYMHVANYVEAASLYSQSLSIAIRLKDEPLTALLYRNMGTLAFNQQDHAKSMEYNLKALAIYERRNDLARKADVLKSIADNKLTEGNLQEAEKYYNSVINIYKQTGNKLGEAMAYSNLSLVYGTRYEEKLRMAFKAKQLFDSVSTENPIPAINTGNIGVAYLDMVRYNHLHLVKPSANIPAGKNEILQLADKYLREAVTIAQQKNDVSNAAYFTGVLAELQEYNGDFKNAYYNIRKYFETNDSIFSQANKNEIAGLQNKQEIDLKNAEIENKELKIRNQQTSLLLLAVGIAFLLLIGFLLYRQSRLRKKNNEILQQLNAELAEANRVKARFFAILSHDLRSPVANLVSFLQLQQNKPGLLSEEKIREHEAKIRTNAQSLLETMEGMLLWSKRQMEHFKPVIREVKVQELFDYLNNFFATTQGVSFSFSGADGLLLNTDENYVKTILHNLTSNAVKAVRSSTNPAIEWKAWKDDNRIYLTITDNGPGIPPGQAQTFLQGNGATDSKHGLGLYIIRDLAKAIDCVITLEPVQSGTRLKLAF